MYEKLILTLYKLCIEIQVIKYSSQDNILNEPGELRS